MTRLHVDVLVLGAGFGGSLLSAVLAKNGKRVAVVDRGVHPRFAIGESSTPLADAILKQIATRYGLQELLPLTQYGSWKRCYSQLRCGVKTGFSYFGHRAGAAFVPRDQLLVAASNSAMKSDTHWLRSDVDLFLCEYAAKQGASIVQGADYFLSGFNEGWCVEGSAEGREFAFVSEFIVDATGGAGEVLRHLGVAENSDALKTNSTALFAHFDGVPTVAATLAERGVDLQPHPFNCDAAAVHHVLEDGWMWQLRFDDDTVSAGILVNGDSCTAIRQSEKSLQAVWDDRLKPYAFVASQFTNASVVRPQSGLQQTGRLQRICERAAGNNWAALANAAGFVDPLHSTGIAHTMSCVQRLAAILLNEAAKPRTESLRRYSDDLMREIRLVDEMVEGCYAALPGFRLWSDWCMLYFAAVTSAEQSPVGNEPTSFLRASDSRFRSMLAEARQRLQRVIDLDRDERAISGFEEWLRAAIGPWNHVGLMDDSVNGMYRSTAAPDR